MEQTFDYFCRGKGGNVDGTTILKDVFELFGGFVVPEGPGFVEFKTVHGRFSRRDGRWEDGNASI